MLLMLDSCGTFADRHDWFHPDTTHLSAAEAAERIIARFDLPTTGV